MPVDLMVNTCYPPNEPGESQWSPCPLLPSIILLSSCFQIAPLLFSHYYIHKCTHNILFYTPSAPQLYPSLPYSPSLHFRFLRAICGFPLLLAPLPTFPYHI